MNEGAIEEWPEALSIIAGRTGDQMHSMATTLADLRRRCSRRATA